MLKLLAALAAPALIVAAPAHAFTSDRISVTVQGSGPDVILIPGLTSQPRVWASTVAAVPGYRYHLVQLAGFAGKPAGGNAQGQVTAQSAEEIARYIREAKLKQPAIVGHSMGGTMGMMIAARHPQLVGRLMVVDMVPWVGAFFGPPGQATMASVKPIADKMLADSQATTDEAKRQEQMTTMIGTMVNDPAGKAAALADARASDRGVVARAYHELMLTDLSPELGRITVPTTVLFVRPAGLPITDAQMEGFYAQVYAPLKGATLTRVPNSAHFIMDDAPDRFRTELKSFLTARPS